jgi:enoyl-[acyl-carrier protein] reductase III
LRQQACFAIPACLSTFESSDMLNFSYKNYWALILGASSGMGLATAKQLAEKGMNLLLVHRDPRSREKELDHELDALRALGVRVHRFNNNALQESNAMEMLAGFKEILQVQGGKIRLLLHSIAKGNLKKMVDEGAMPLLEEDLRITLHAMGTSLWQWARWTIEAGLFCEDARIIALTSEGSQRSWPGYAAVGAAKSVLENLARSMALELAPLGIRTNIVQPGLTDTAAFRQIPGHETLKQMALEKNPFKRITTPEDVARVIALLCTDEAAWINGALIHADGGEHCS